MTIEDIKSLRNYNIAYLVIGKNRLRHALLTIEKYCRESVVDEVKGRSDHYINLIAKVTRDALGEDWKRDND
uniref:Uncharacterized protein n=1 Tax=viral metagenome TaxID=1070528 RepID=A0A6H1ZA69_9ZZZZ